MEAIDDFLNPCKREPPMARTKADVDHSIAIGDMLPVHNAIYSQIGIPEAVMMSRPVPQLAKASPDIFNPNLSIGKRLEALIAQMKTYPEFFSRFGVHLHNWMTKSQLPDYVRPKIVELLHNWESETLYKNGELTGVVDPWEVSEDVNAYNFAHKQSCKLLNELGKLWLDEESGEFGWERVAYSKKG